jgi:hypothetical protein
VNVKVRIVVETDGQSCDGGRFPAELTWTSEHHIGLDNPRFYGDSIQKALKRAVREAVAGVDPYVELRDKHFAEDRP